jgi:hypothetical protein
MKKFVILPLAVYSHLLFAGGFSGGGPPPLLIEGEELLRIIQPDLGLQKLEIPATDFRRARARLSESSEAVINIEGERILIKEKAGGLIDITESLQIMPM